MSGKPNLPIGPFPHGTQSAYPPPSPGKVYSAVLAALTVGTGGGKLLFTRRGDQLADHSGQIAFPGGRAETGDSGPLQTAIREAHEEVGIPPEHILPLGILDPVDTSTGFRIWPVAAMVTRPADVRIAPPEVVEAFWIPLAWLREKGRWEWRTVPSGAGRGTRRAVFFEAYRGKRLWGATAWITVQLLQMLPEGRIA
jgi:8-oxo-dGTP pyrophosphatase MutT (NUDIX family)